VGPASRSAVRSSPATPRRRSGPLHLVRLTFAGRSDRRELRQAGIPRPVRGRSCRRRPSRAADPPGGSGGSWRPPFRSDPRDRDHARVCRDARVGSSVLRAVRRTGGLAVAGPASRIGLRGPDRSLPDAQSRPRSRSADHGRKRLAANGAGRSAVSRDGRMITRLIPCSGAVYCIVPRGSPLREGGGRRCWFR
jgi:hypothetical protein